MCTVLAALEAAGTLYQGIATNNAARAQSEAQARALETNAKIAENQGHDVIARGGEEEIRLRRSIAQRLGNQRAQAAASGISPDSGSALDVRNANINEGEHDAAAIRYNAARERWGYQTQAADYRNQASAVRSSGRAAGRNALFESLLSAGTGAYGNYEEWRRARKSSPLTKGA